MKSKKSLILLTIPILFFLQYCENPLDADENITVDGINYQLSVEKKQYHLSDTLKFKFVLTNLSGSVSNFYFSSSCQLGFRIKFTEESFIDFPEPCLAVLTGLSVNPGESKEVSKTYLLNGNNSLRSGKALLEAFLYDNNSPVLSTKIAFF